MEFRLTYEGPIRATQRDSRPGQPSRHIENKHLIRVAFHKQLRRLWSVVPALQPQNGGFLTIGVPQRAITKEALAEKHHQYGFSFVPLVTQELDLLCSLEILFLRPDRPGELIWAGDIDNRLKTLLDAMRIPEPAEEYTSRQPAEDEEPFFCLLEDDKLITRVSVETDRLLQPTSANSDASDARIVVTVKVTPYSLNPSNHHLA